LRPLDSRLRGNERTRSCNAHFYKAAINAHESEAIITPLNVHAKIKLAKRFRPSNFPTKTLDFKYRENP